MAAPAVVTMISADHLFQKRINTKLYASIYFTINFDTIETMLFSNQPRPLQDLSDLQ